MCPLIGCQVITNLLNFHYLNLSEDTASGENLALIFFFPLQNPIKCLLERLFEWFLQDFLKNLFKKGRSIQSFVYSPLPFFPIDSFFE